MPRVSDEGLRAGETKMREAGLAEEAIAYFRHYYGQLVEGQEGVIPESEIEPVEELPAISDLEIDGAARREALDSAVILKLNGGLGTSMGLEKAKSLLEVKDGLTFLDLIVEQTLELRRREDARLPLLLMNSLHTRDDSLAALARYEDLPVDVAPDFLQNRIPKIGVDDLKPASWPANASLEWCPPGHGDVYSALVTSGMLDELLDRGYAYLFISNSDNLGAVLEPRILAWMAAEQIPFVSEQCRRTEADRKGGHLARGGDGRLVLRETAQTSDEDKDAFEDIERHRFFNTNNVWVDIRVLKEVFERRDGVLGLPMIRNRKTVDPADSSSPAVYQLETAMGAALGVFEGSRAVLVPRSRFTPVKTTNDLLGLRSDAYVVDEHRQVVVSPERTRGPLLVDLDPDSYKLLPAFEERFAQGPPSLVECDRFTVRGDVEFGRDVVARGRVEIDRAGEGRTRIEDGAVLEG
jgi:UTP--glucose-1-phosphate uridylyltransferase